MNSEVKENFCGACIAAPLAIAGVGVAGVGSRGSGSNKKTKTVMLWSGIALTILSLIVMIWYMTRCKQCM